MTKGIYQIKNKIDGKIYIGSSLNIKKRLGVHKRDLRKNIHYNTYLQRAWNKYGSDNFEFTVIMEVPDGRFLPQIEQEHLNKFNSYSPNGYNMSHDTIAPMRGMKFSEKRRKAMSEAKMGNKNPQYGKHHIVTEATRKILSEKNKGQIPWSKGRHFTKEHRDKISIARKGTHPTDETRKKLSESHKGQRPWMTGKHHAEDARKKMSEGIRKYFQNKNQINIVSTQLVA